MSKPLDNPQWEAFCVGIARLKMTAADAARHAKFEPNSARTRGYRLMKDARIKARIEAIEAEQQKALDVANPPEPEVPHEPNSLEWLLAEHARNLAISKARADTRETRATLVEVGKLTGRYVERQEVTTKSDALPMLGAADLSAVMQAVTILRARLVPSAPVIDQPSDDQTTDYRTSEDRQDPPTPGPTGGVE